MKTAQGMTISEYILIIAIIGIIVLVGLVIYKGIYSRGCVVKAEDALIQVTKEEKMYKEVHGTYPPNGVHKDYLPFFGGNGTPGSGKNKVKVGDYMVTMTVQTPYAFVVRANPIPGSKMEFKKGEKLSGWLEINQNGQRNSQSTPNKWP